MFISCYYPIVNYHLVWLVENVKNIQELSSQLTKSIIFQRGRYTTNQSFS